jgi:heterodisulfide reductase subunit C
MGLSNLIFALFLGAAFFLLRKNILKIRRNILVGRDIDRSDRPIERWKMMAKVALGQSKMVVRPVAGILHIIVYVGFVVINIEVLEILIDGLFGTHRIFSFLGGIYDVLIGSFEILAFLVLVACIVFYIRRNVLRIKRFVMKEMDGWPKTDANLILLFEVVLMCAFLLMQAADLTLQNAGAEYYVKAGSFPISSHVSFLFEDMSIQSVHLVERGLWWLHILGILTFMNYLPYSKHFHIVLAFPNTYFAKLDAKGAFTNMASVKAEVEMMMDPSADPYAAPEEGASEEEPKRFGAKDVKDLNWLQLMNAYSCTECGRCTSECPANMTGKLLSPRKIMIDTRDRLEEYGANLDKNGPDKEDGKFLLDDYISREELWACTSCNACTEACPLNIDPLSIILDMRRYLVMEESTAPTELNAMFTNVENNGAPWQFPAVDRLNWKDEA